MCRNTLKHAQTYTEISYIRRKQSLYSSNELKSQYLSLFCVSHPKEWLLDTNLSTETISDEASVNKGRINGRVRYVSRVLYLVFA